MTSIKQLIISLLILLLVILGSLWFLGSQRYPGKTFTLGGEAFYATLADDDYEREQGLSGTQSLPPNQAMLFEFEQAAPYCFWMKDMNYPIDMIWLDEVRNISYIKRNASPETFPNSFCPPTDAKYVVEVPAGTADRLKLEYGDNVSF